MCVDTLGKIRKFLVCALKNKGDRSQIVGRKGEEETDITVYVTNLQPVFSFPFYQAWNCQYYCYNINMDKNIDFFFSNF
jgi:hypothetical protein